LRGVVAGWNANAHRHYHLGAGFRVLADREVAFDSKGDSTLSMPLRRIEIERQDAKPIARPIIILTNDMTRSTVEIAALYKARWQIELLFGWIKQHLELSRFLGNNQNAIQLVRSALFVRKPMANLHNPPPLTPPNASPPAQTSRSSAMPDFPPTNLRKRGRVRVGAETAPKASRGSACSKGLA
jgi:hypothetical protein